MNEKIILTVCSLNHIGQAKCLGDSILKFAPDYKFIIGLADRLDGRVPENFISSHRVIEAEAIQIPQFDEMQKRYNVLELNCALKSFFTGYVLEQLKPRTLIYLDSDILLFNSLRTIEAKLEHASILLTPHITNPFPDDGHHPMEKVILRTGIYNAGFYALINDDTARSFVNWWKDRMIDQCFEKPKEGLNVDQNWLNFVPLFFNNVQVLRHPGCNVAYWNLHERRVEKKDNEYIVNEEPLIFFHFSGYSMHQPQKISKHQDRFSMDKNPVVKELFHFYHDALVTNKHAELQKIPCVYQKKKGLLGKLEFKKLK